MSLIQVEPPELRFENVLPGTLYVMTFSVRNLSQTAQRIRISAPKSGLFALNYIPAGAVAPGLDLRAEIECQLPAELTDFVFTDKIVATMGNERVEIPISALKPHARIKFDHSLPFGNILLRQSLTKDMVFTNTSDIGGTMKLVLSRTSKLKLSTMKLDFKPRGEEGSVIKVGFTIEGREVGLVREFVKVQMVGTVDEMHIDVSAQVVEQNLTLLTENQQGTLDNAHFGNIFFGETKTIQSLLVNSGPLPLSFTVKYDDEEEAATKEVGISSSSGDPNALLEQFYMKSLVVSPVDGIVKPFSQVTMTLTFTPVLAVPEKGFVQQHLKDYEEARLVQRLVKIECLDSLQSIPLQLAGQAHIPAMGISPPMLRFGECPVNDRRDILVTLSNRTKLPLSFEFPVVATFKFNPLKGRLMPHEHVSVIASFLPPQLGQFKTKVPLTIGDGLKTYELKVVGTSELVGGKKLLVTGTDKLPEDFVPKYKFVDPEEEAEARLEKRQAKERKALELDAQLRTMLSPSTNKKKLFSLDAGQAKPVQLSDLETVPLPPVIQAASESDDLYGTGAPQISDLKDEHAREQARAKQFNLEMYEMTRKHNQTYNAYLQQSHHQRELRRMAQDRQKLIDRGAIDFSDPFGVNMGMERGLDEPQLRAPTADEPLWTTAMMTAGAASSSSAAGGGGNAPRKMPTDENRLIQKKYPATPATQAELRDCSKELSSDELKLVTASHKTLDFGRVCVGSVTAKNFVAFNNLHHALLVTVEELDLELQQSRALAQVIPPNCMAGFDLCFSSRVVGKVKKTFTWKVNGLHQFKVLVLAEVLPIELVLNKSELVMEFPLDSLKPTLTTEVILTNPGNAHAEFLWGSVGAFTCDPERGTIPPGKSSVVSITWDPLSGKRPEEELGLHITGGVDQVLKVRGVLKDTKAEFADKRLSLGVMAVGTEKTLVTSIHNSGAHEVVFFLQPLDAALGIRLEPTEAMILPGESADITITVTPKSARNYDNTTIHAKLRGGKAIAMKLAGSSIVPQIEIPQTSWVFGAVTVGSHVRLPLTIYNHSPITATLLLDLSAYEDFAPNLLRPIEDVDLATQENGPVATLQEDDVGNSLMLFSRGGGGGGGGGGAMDVSSASGLLSSSSPTSSTSKRGGGGKGSPRSGGGGGKKRRRADSLWKVTLTANATLEAELIFRPTAAKKFSFRLPLTLFGIVEDRSLQRDVTATGVASALRLSQTVVDFGDRVVARDPLARVSYYLETTITNQSNGGVSFVVREGDETARTFDGASVDLVAQKAAQQKSASEDGLVGAEPQQIFFVSPLAIDLAPGASTKIRVTFLPQQNVTYSKKLGFFRKDAAPSTAPASTAMEASERPYLSLLCVGSGVYPCMTFSHSHVRLPTVPLGVTSRAQFFVHNNGYAALDVRHRVSPNVPVTLDVAYPDGAQLGIMIDRVRVVVSARSDVPVAWAGKVEFYDADGERFCVTLAGCADNCLLTNYPFVAEYAATPDGGYGFVGVDEQPVQLLPQHQIAELRAWDTKRKEEQRRQRSLERQRLVEGGAAAAGGGGGGSSSVGAASGAGGGAGGGAAKKSVKIQEDGAGGGSVAMAAPGTVASPALKKGKGGARKDAAKTLNLDENRPSHFVEGVDLDRAAASGTAAVAEDAEAFFVLTWLNRTVCRRPFDAAKFPWCLFEHHADGVVDCLEQLSGKKIPNLKGAPPGAHGGGGGGRKGSANGHGAHDDANGGGGGATTKRTSEKAKLIAAADRALYRVQQIVSFLIAHGALLAHVNPIALLSQPEALLMHEHELQRDRSVRLTPSALATRREQWAASWLAQCSAAWLDVLFQAIKKKPAGGGAAADEKKSSGGGPPVPKELQPSNVFTHGEAVLLAWATYHLDHADHLVDDGAAGRPKDDFLRLFGVNKRVTDVDATFRDFFAFCQLLHSHVGVDVTTRGEPLRGYTNIDRATRQDELFALLEDAMQQYHVALDVPADEVLKSTRNVLLLLLHCYLTLPSLVPRTKIDFTGVLGEPITKRIELKNAAKKPLCYYATFKGCDDFAPEAATLLVPAEGATDFLVTLNARFQHQVAGKLYLWNVREPAYAPGATLCFACVSDIRGVKPVESVAKAVGVFDYEIFQLPVRNPQPREVTFGIRYEVRYCAKTIEDYLKGDGGGAAGKKTKKNAAEIWTKLPLTRPTDDEDGGGGDDDEMRALFSGLGLDESKANGSGGGGGGKGGGGGGGKLAADEWELENMCRQPFWIVDETVTLPKQGTKNIAVHLLPFTMGKYSCTITFFDAECGEFCYQINADVGLPRAADKIDAAVLLGQPSHLAVTFNAKNAPFEKAFTVLTDVRVKNANKKIKARGVCHSFLAAAVAREDTGQATFAIDFTAPFFATRRTFPLVSEYLRWPPASTAAAAALKGNAVGGGVTAATATNPNAAKVKKPGRTQLELLAALPDDDHERDWLNRAILTFEPARAGHYRALAVVRPADNPRDVRCVEFNVVAKVPDAKMTLEFNGPARQLYTQEIPVANETDADWALAVALVGGRGFATDVKSLLVPAHGVVTLRVRFFPLAAGEVDAKLTLRNAETNDLFEYALVGVTDDPLAEQSLVYRCAARQPATFTLQLPSLAAIFQPDVSHVAFPTADADGGPGAVQFLVESDVPFTAVPEAPLALSVADLHRNVDFDFTVNCPLGGQLLGALTFTDVATGASFWYALTLHVSSPQEETTIDVATTVRVGCAVDITLTNPLDEPLTFDVTFDGDGLRGEAQYTLPPRSSSSSEAAAPYELIYAPLLAGRFVGRVNFANETVGELWYKLRLTAAPAPPTELPLVEAMLGAEAIVTATVENPLGEHVVFAVESTDAEHFFIANGGGANGGASAASSMRVAVAPFGTATVPITFRPSSLNETVTAELVLTHRAVGELRYRVHGRGLLPGVMPPLRIDGPLHEIVSQSILFRNPFARPVAIDVTLTDAAGNVLDAAAAGDAAAGADAAGAAGASLPLFSLLLRKKHDVVVAPKTTFHVPVAFSPPTMGVFSALVTVRAPNAQGHDLLWCYPVHGTAEVGQVHRWPPLLAPAKTSRVLDAVLPLSGLPPSGGGVTTAEFAVSFDVDEPLRNLVTRSFQIQPLEIVTVRDADADANAGADAAGVGATMLGLRCRLVFEPLRVFATTVHVAFVSTHRGKWRAKIDLEAQDPAPDDVIRLTAPVHGVDRVSFRLSNRFLGYSTFQAFFASHSSPHFTVEPKTGLLAPYDKNESTTFVVTFAPKEYGMIEQATLHVLTDDAQWTYAVRGAYPEIVGPNAPNAAPIKSKLLQPTAATLAGQRRK
eukprot:gene4189-2988_t